MKQSFIFITCISIFLSGCKKDNSASTLSSEKSVVSFKASNSGISSMTVFIDNDKRRIAIAADCPTYQGDIKVTPVVSDKATCSLAAGTILDLRGTKKFKVTAEDGSTQEYSVFVQGCSIYSSHFYKDCFNKTKLDCTVNDINKKSYLLTNNELILKFKSASLFDDFQVTLNFSDTNFKNGTPQNYNINPLRNVESKASFTYDTNTFSYLGSPNGKISVTNIDTENRLVSGSFYFGQTSVKCSTTTDYIAGEFYSIPY
jgi:hypothetical protein